MAGLQSAPYFWMAQRNKKAPDLAWARGLSEEFALVYFLRSTLLVAFLAPKNLTVKSAALCASNSLQEKMLM